MSKTARNALTAFALAIALGLVALSAGCQRKVEVETGTRVLCSYGHTIKDDSRVVKVPVKEAVDYYIKTQVTTCDKHAQAEKLYQEAQDAILAGRLEEARQKLAKVVSLDASYGSAKRQLAQIDADKTPSVDDGTDGGAAPSDGDEGDDPAATPTGKLTAWTPATVAGWTGSKVVIDVFTVSRDYRPDQKGPAIIMVIVAEQQRTAIGAKTMMDKLVKKPCPYDATTVSVNGRQAYFGTDNRRLATLSFIEGPVMVAIQMAAPAEGDPIAMKPGLIAVAKALP